MPQVIMGVPTASSKNEIIKVSLKATKARRTQQRCRVFEVKLDSSHLNQHTQAQLKRLFLEAKWLYNHILSQPNVCEVDYKLTAVPVKVKNVRSAKQEASLLQREVVHTDL
jgi:putative transposase